MIKPIANQQKKQRGKIGTFLERVDTQTKQIYTLDAEIGKFKYDLKFIDKCINDLEELERRIRTLEEKVEAKGNETNKKINTLADKLKSNDAQVRALDNDVTMMRNEAQVMNKLFSEAREAQNVIFEKAVERFEYKVSDLLKQ